MGWSVGFDSNWNRFIGYGVPAYCDHPNCNKEIHRGLSYVCGEEPYGGDNGCGLYFCYDHLLLGEEGFVCERCIDNKPPFEPKPEHPDWINWMLTDSSWEEWRQKNPMEVEKLKRIRQNYMDEISGIC